MRRTLKKSLRGSIAAGALALFAQGVPAFAQQQTHAFDIPAQDLGSALRVFARAAREQVTFDDAAVRGRQAPALRGSFTARAALDRLLAGSGLSAQQGRSGIFVIRPNPAAQSGETEAGSAAADDGSADDIGAGQAEILVVGSQSQNVDIRRTEDDPQPYAVYTAEEIERSGATTVEDFFRTRVSANTSAESAAQSASNATNISSINLRGLGANQTLILIDGRRAPRVQQTGFDFSQADINGIPLAAIERIEVLPSTAGGIYGGGATGGVVNIIRRRDYRGLDLRVGYGGAFRGGAETLRLDLSGGFSLNGGDTQISFSASRTESSPLHVGDNDLWRRGRSLLVANDPAANLFVGFTPNIRSTNGANLVLLPQFGGGSLGSNHTYVPIGYGGIAADGVAPLVGNAGQYNIALSNDLLGRRATMLGNPRIQSANVNLRQTISSSIEAFADFSISENVSRKNTVSPTGPSVTLARLAPNNPFNQAVRVFIPLPGVETPSFGKSSNMAATAGIIARIAPGWTATAEYDWSRSRVAYRFVNVPISAAGRAVLQNGTIDILRDVNRFPIDLTPYLQTEPDSFSGPYVTVLQLGSARISGNLIDLPGGPLALTALAERRSERAEQSETITPFLRQVLPRRTQTVTSAYAELRAPIVSDRNAMPFVHALELQASARYDYYRTRTATPSVFQGLPTDTQVPDFGFSSSSVDSAAYTLAVRWMPTRDLAFRASYATGFLPPSINDLTPILEPGDALFGFTDPLRGGEIIGTNVPFQIRSDGNPDLDPETSRSYSFGAVLTPRFADGLRFSADYTHIRKRGEIVGLPFDTFLANETLFPGRIQRAPALPGDPAGFPGPITLIDITKINAAFTTVSAWDFQAEYAFEAGRLGRFRLYAVATLQDSLRRRLSLASQGFELVGFSDGPLEWRGNFGLDWTIGNVDLSWNAQYYDGYSVRNGSNPTSATSNNAVVLQGAETIPSQMYHDLNVRYRFPEQSASFLRGMDVSLGIQNVFDHRPPALAASINGYSRYGDPRLRRFTLSLHKHF